MDLLSQQNLKINFQNKNFELGTFSLNDGYPFKRYRTKILIKLELNDVKIDNFIFDSGCHKLAVDNGLQSKLSL